VFAAFVENYLEIGDANDVLYAFGASSDYDPKPALEKLRAPLVAVNSADDLINPPELGVLEKEITRVAPARVVMMPYNGSARPRLAHGGETVDARIAGVVARNGALTLSRADALRRKMSAVTGETSSRR